VARNREAFVSLYGVDVRLASGVGDAGQFGVFSGQLANGGETISLLDDSGRIVQQFTFDDGWHDGTDGDGRSLELVDATQPISTWNDAASWRASAAIGGTPGQSYRVVGDSNEDGVFDTNDLLLAFQSGEYEDNVPNNSAWADGDWNGDGEFTSADLVLAFQVGGYVPTGELNPAIPSTLSTDALDAVFEQLGDDISVRRHAKRNASAV
jgi:hypothetical protein